jgi:hypothetical protein
MKANFTIVTKEGIRTLYFSYRGRLVKVAEYVDDTDDEDEWDAIHDRDAKIFLRGFNYRE